MDIDQHMKERYGASLIPSLCFGYFMVYESRHARYIVEQRNGGSGDRFTVYGYIGHFEEKVK